MKMITEVFYLWYTTKMVSYYIHYFLYSFFTNFYKWHTNLNGVTYVYSIVSKRVILLKKIERVSLILILHKSLLCVMYNDCMPQNNITHSGKLIMNEVLG